MPVLFADRRDAGRQLAAQLAPRGLVDPVVVALPRGGVPVAAEVARQLGAPLHLLVVRKVGAPGHAELGIGAVASGGMRVLNDEIITALELTPRQIDAAVALAEHQLAERVARYGAHAATPDVTGRTAIVVDDGLATGGTARAAGIALRALRPRHLMLAVPIGAPDAVAALEDVYDEVVCLQQPESLWSIGSWYVDFQQTADAEVAGLLAQAAGTVSTVEIPIGPLAGLPADLTVPAGASGLVVFAHGSGSSRHSPRNQTVARRLNDAGFATLLLDLLTPREAGRRANVFDVALLAARVGAALAWRATDERVAALPTGLFGASTGAAAALWAAADAPGAVRAVVSRGGRPDLAGPRLGEVAAPTLLIVGGRDDDVLGLNRAALSRLRCPAELQVVPGATHLFEEPGAMDVVQSLAAGWFARHLA